MYIGTAVTNKLSAKWSLFWRCYFTPRFTVAFLWGQTLCSYANRVGTVFSCRLHDVMSSSCPVYCWKPRLIRFEMDFWFKTFFQTCTYTPTTLSQLAASYSPWRSLLFIHFSHQSYSLFTSQWFACHLVTTFGHLSLSLFIFFSLSAHWFW